MQDRYPAFEYCIAGHDDTTGDGDSFVKSSIWDISLDGRENDDLHKIPPITLGNYFLSAHKFLEGDNYSTLRKGLKYTLSCNVEVDEIKKIIICLVKHGPFYHPIKVTVILKNKKLASFVLNGAISEAGLATIENEYQNLDELSSNKPEFQTLIPKVFGIGFIPSNRREIGFFLGQWFEGFEEFHVVKTDNKVKVGILNKDDSFSLIPDSTSFKIYEQASKILTLYYDITSLKQISPWHHAAGDFIVKIKEEDVEVKLITVRRFNNLMESEDLFSGLFFFFLNLTLRMRMDRNRGTKEYIFFSKKVVPAIISGFTNGLKKNLKTDQKFYVKNPDFYDLFIEFIKEFDSKNLLNAFIMILGSYNKDTPEAEIIGKNLVDHAKVIFDSIQEL